MAEYINYDAWIERYKTFIASNPAFASQLESYLRWISYITAGRFEHSPIISELIYSASSLLGLVNDTILRKAANIPLHVNTSVESLQRCLAILEYTEVFLEIASSRLGGPSIRWIVITVIQLIKTALHLVLLLRFDQGIQKCPAVSPLNRRRDLSQLQNRNKKENGHNSNEKTNCTPMEVTFSLKRSGRTIRTLAAAPPLSKRTWKLPESEKQPKNTPKIHFPPTSLEGQQFAAELLHLMRPMTHLATMGLYGTDSWKPWIVALGMDVSSLHLLRENEQLNHAEQLELTRRALMLVMFLLRSPFYDRFSREKILQILSSIARNIPVMKLFMYPLMEYLPEWQKSYFHTWVL
ncbi:peroxisomal membrane protein PEX16-like [Limulus polyphemus]|uniref:Peroxisomal membrane protein PEX16 n=1 Tax=Limulus polyphemus TaxID=6850 RepID=A0ABM1BPM3_LIMPO|nr:peroxisomal membrane protein PEX16-like [Limulus polyphemus]